MRAVVLSLAVFLLLTGHVLAEEKVRVADPYIELYTQPGEGHPIYHVVERGQWVTILKRQTDWFKVQTADNKIGWVTRRQMAGTLTASGEQFQITDTGLSDFSKRGWEVGTLWGNVQTSEMFTVYGAWAFNQSLSAEVSVSQLLGNLTTSNLINVGLVTQVFSDDWISPYFSIATGIVNTSTRATLVSEVDTSDQTASFAIGVRTYLSRTFFLRVEYRELVIFSSTDNNEELEIWSVGVGSFF
ncbi:MAG: SH3 domain-containing protein [Gammaproteobacteria bacterium]|nr:SH3 domain-containing protein [Gammaproteobacteria bacterium]MDH5651555.1 SH3 domain-containing protein [Gammaproteobacteria bacterium]